MTMYKKEPKGHLFMCQVDGMVYPSTEKRIRWDGAIVHKLNWEPRHPQDFVTPRKEDTSVDNPNPEPGYGSDQGEGYTFVEGACDIIFGLVDEFGNQIVTEDDDSIQVPPTAANL